MKKVFLLCTLVLFANCEDVKSVSTTPIVTLDSGIYEGLSKRLPGATQEIHQYLGIPFAAPPTRFAPPQPPPKSNAVKKAQEFPPACIQAKNSTAKESEDCLYLNIYVPVPNGKNDRAVMIFLYGGGLQSGDASYSLYDGTSFATNQDVIIVVPNYRTNGGSMLT
jgi:carboxylesterase type B